MRDIRRDLRHAVLGGGLVSLLALALGPAPAAGQAGSIEGTVLAGEAMPATDAVVALPELGRQARVDDRGAFAFSDVPAGSYVIEATSPAWGRVVDRVSVTSGEATAVTLTLQRFFHLDELVVSAGPTTLRRSEAYQPTSVVTQRDLVTRAEATLGETLSGEPGVSSTYFGPGASRPIVRGLGGDRVRVLQSGIGVGDASNTSPDHAVAIDTRSADRIEVVRGPATLLYGSSAVGGVVNVLDSKIARTLPTAALEGFVEGLGGSVSNEKTGSGSLTGTVGRLVFHGSGIFRSTDDYSIPGFAEAEHDDEGEEHEEHAGEEEEVEGILENSALESQSGALGVTYVGEKGYLGASLSGYFSEYGVPGHGHGHEEEHEGEEEHAEGEEEGVIIDLDQTRFDVEGALRFDEGPVRNVKVRFGLGDYEHRELEGEEVGTLIENRFTEARVESQHTLTESVAGAIGAQVSSRDFSAAGEEAFVPPTDTRILALFAFEEWAATDAFRVQLGGRWDNQRAESTSTGVDRTDNAFSVSLGGNWTATEHLSFAVSGSRSVKLPTPEELFSDGPHAATRAFEIGDPELEAEEAWGTDVGVHLHFDRVRGSVSLFGTWFDDFIFAQATGGERDELDVFRYVQFNARFLGFEAETEIDLLHHTGRGDEHHLSLDLSTDVVNARLTSLEQDVPRIPPLRIGGGLNYSQGPIVARGGVRWHAEQTRVGAFEEETDGYTMVDASVSYRLFTGRAFHDISLVGTNLADQEARPHTSFLKELAPLPGREIRLVYRVSF